MGSVTVSRVIDAPAERAWGIVGAFDSLQSWHPGVSRMRVLTPGVERFFEINGLGTAVERVSGRDDGALRLTYVATDLPLPVSEYTAEISVTPEGPDRCLVTWSSRFTAVNFPDELLEKGVTQFFLDGLEALSRFLTGASANH
jgi:hypothetical protein